MCLLTIKNAWNLIDPRVRRVDIANETTEPLFCVDF